MYQNPFGESIGNCSLYRHGGKQILLHPDQVERRLPDIIKRLELSLKATAERFEKEIGLTNIAKFIVGHPEHQLFVRSYQRLIRGHRGEWPYSDNFAPSFKGLVNRFAKTSAAYVETAIRLHQGISKEGNSQPISFLYETAIFSEAARGREGKRSKIGLDHLQESLVEELSAMMKQNWASDLGDLEEAINMVVQTVLSGHTSAAELPEKFMRFIDLCNHELTLDNLHQVNLATDGLAAEILREFCCYSVSKFNRNLILYRQAYDSIRNKSGLVHKKQECKRKLMGSIKKLLDTVSPGEADKFIELVYQIDVLNYMNDSIDVKYSFKSWPGFFHWVVFSAAIEATGEADTLQERASHLYKYNL